MLWSPKQAIRNPNNGRSSMGSDSSTDKPSESTKRHFCATKLCQRLMSLISHHPVTRWLFDVVLLHAVTEDYHWSQLYLGDVEADSLNTVHSWMSPAKTYNLQNEVSFSKLEIVVGQLLMDFLWGGRYAIFDISLIKHLDVVDWALLVETCVAPPAPKLSIRSTCMGVFAHLLPC